MSNIEVIAKYFDRQLDAAPAGETLPVFFERIEDDQVRNAVISEIKQLAEEYANSDYCSDRSLERFACLKINYRLRKEFEIPAGDWSYVPMINCANDELREGRLA